MKSNQPKWLKRLIDRIGELAASGASKHARGCTRPRTWHRDLRARRKRQRQARKAQRGK